MGLQSRSAADRSSRVGRSPAEGEGRARVRQRSVHRRSRSRSASEPGPGRSAAFPPARERFQGLDTYRVGREWKRYEGTPQRDLFRELRERFLRRHASTSGWVVDLGAGPGRFTPLLGGPASRRVLLDLSLEMLREARRRHHGGPGEPAPDLVRGDAARPPFKHGQFSEVALLGNVVGFSEREADRVLRSALDLLTPDGTVIVESAPSTGERSRYLARLPPGALRRLLVAPVNAIRPRVEREGFRPEVADVSASAFRRMREEEVVAALAGRGFQPVESLAIAPALGSDPVRIAAVRLEPAAWRHLLELEESLGRTAPRRARAAALLVAGRRVRTTGDKPAGAMG